MEEMHRLANEIREVFSERGFLIEKATGLDPAFRRGRGPQSALSRNVVLDTIDQHASRLGISTIPVSGGGYDLQVFVGDADRRFRVRKATKSSETGAYDVIVDSDAILEIPDAEIDSLYRHERWIFGYTTDDSGIVEDIFGARGLRVSGEVIKKLVMVDVTPLGISGSTSNDEKFTGDDEDDLPGFGDDSDDTGFAGGTEHDRHLLHQRQRRAPSPHAYRRWILPHRASADGRRQRKRADAARS